MPRILVVADAPAATDLAATLDRDHGMDAAVTDGTDEPPLGPADCLVYDAATAGIALDALLAAGDDVPVVVLRSLDAIRDRPGSAVGDVATRIEAALPADRRDEVWTWAETAEDAPTDGHDGRSAPKEGEEATEIRRQRDRLAALDRINGVIRDVDQLLVGASTRAEIERGVCERLAASDSYRFAWIGAEDVGTGEVVPRASAGVGDGYLDEVTVTATEGAAGRGPTGRALRTGAIAVAQRLDEDPAYERWRELALARGYRSSAAIPLAYGGTTYGVLNVYAGRPDAFDERERAVLDELGGTIGHAMNAVESKRLLVSDGITELEIRVPNADGFFARASARLDCRIELEGTVGREEGSPLQFWTVSGSDVAGFERHAASSSEIGRFEVVSGTADSALCKLTFDGTSVVPLLADHGARTRSVVAADGELAVIAAVPHGTDVRTLFVAFRGTFPTAELVAQRESGRPIRTKEAFRAAAVESLTDKQRTALRTAHLSGFFEWPRMSTGEDVAETLDVSPATFHQHLRVGQEKLMDALFDE